MSDSNKKENGIYNLQKYKENLNLDFQIIDLILYKLDKISRRTIFLKNIIILLFCYHIVKNIFKYIKIFKKKNNNIVNYKKFNDSDKDINEKYDECIEYDESSCFEGIISECKI